MPALSKPSQDKRDLRRLSYFHTMKQFFDPLRDVMKRESFYVKDCALAAIATGEQARNLSEFRDRLARIHPDSIYYHFWGNRLEPQFEHPEYHNDFAAWAHHALHDHILAERLGILDPTGYGSIEDLRDDIIAIVDARLDDRDWAPWKLADRSFSFVRSNIIVFPSQITIRQPPELARIVPTFSRSSIFYHFIDARRRNESSCDDFSMWLRGFDRKYAKLLRALADIDPYFIPLTGLRAHLAELFAGFFKERSA